MQEAFLRLWQKRADVSPPKVKSFLFTVANNLFLDEVKHKKVVLKFFQHPQKDVTLEHPQFVLESEEFKAQLEQAIAALPEKSRVVFLMNRIDKLSYKDIAERLELSVKTIEKRMHRALLAMRKLNEKI